MVSTTYGRQNLIKQVSTASNTLTCYLCEYIGVHMYENKRGSVVLLLKQYLLWSFMTEPFSGLVRVLPDHLLHGSSIETYAYYS